MPINVEMPKIVVKCSAELSEEQSFITFGPEFALLTLLTLLHGNNIIEDLTTHPYSQHLCYSLFRSIVVSLVPCIGSIVS